VCTIGYTITVRVRRFSVCGLAALALMCGCSKAKGPEGTWEVSTPAIATTADRGVEVPAPKATLTINDGGSFTLAVEGPRNETSRGTWQSEGNNLLFRVKGEDGAEHDFNGALSDDGKTLRAFGFEFKRR
jgi:ABC-type uncharacterized transport system auxiliary subunit